MVFAIRGDVAGPMSATFHITNEQMGMVFSPAFFAFTLAIFITGNLIDIVGMRALHALSAIGFILGVALVTLAPHPDGPVASLFGTRARRCSSSGSSCSACRTDSSRA